MNPQKRRELQSRAAAVQPPAVNPPPMQSMGQQTMPDGSPVADGVKVKAYGKGVEANVTAIHPSMAPHVGGPQTGNPGVHVRGARVLPNGPTQGASVTMQGAARQGGVRGARMTEMGGAPAPMMAPVARAGAPAPVMAPVAQPGPQTPWMGSRAPEVAPQAKPDVNLTVVLALRSRPQFLERQLRAIAAATVRPVMMECHINPVGVQLPDRLLQQIPTQRESVDRGPWMRWRLAQEALTKYVLILDDDCVPGMNWIRLALERLETAERMGEKIVVCAGGLVFQQDAPDEVYPLGPEAPRMDEGVADIGRGAWLLPRDLLTDILDYPRDLFSAPGSGRVAVPMLVAAALQENDYHQVVLPYAPADKSGWGMLEPPTYEGSTSHMIDVQAKANADVPAAWYRADVYGKLRGAGWEPMVVIATADTVQDPIEGEFGTAPAQTGPVPAAMPSVPAAAAAPAKPKAEATAG